MKRKGFTLIELLGVLVLLALIVLLAWSRLSNTITEVRKTLSEENLKLIYSAAENYIENNSEKYPRISGNKYCVSLEVLANEGLLPDELKNYVNDQDISLQSTVELTVNAKRKYEFNYDPNENICDLSVVVNAKTRGTEKVKPRNVVSGEVIDDDVIINLTQMLDKGNIKYCLTKDKQHFEISENDKNSCNPSQNYSDPIELIPENGEKTKFNLVYIYVGEGIEDTSKIERHLFSVVYDPNAPEFNFLINELSTQGKTLYDTNLSDWARNDVEAEINNAFTPTGKIEKYEIEITQGPEGTVKAYNGKSLILDKTGEYVLKSRVETNMGAKKERGPVTVRVDKTNPTFEVRGIPTDWVGNDVTLRVVASDEGSGLADKPYSYDNGLTWETSPTKVIKGNGKVNIKVKDKVGNETFKSITIDQIDKTEPTVYSLERNIREYTSSNIQLVADIQDDASGIVAYQFSTTDNLTKDSEGWNPITNTTERITQSFEVSANNTYYFYAKDKVGNVNKVSIEVDNIDKNAPVITSFVSDVTQLVNHNIIVTGEATDNYSGFSGYAITKSSTPPANADDWEIVVGNLRTLKVEKEISENATYYLHVKDGAGLVTTKSLSITNIDKDAPNITNLVHDATDYTNQDVIITGTVIDDNSGIVAYQFTKTDVVPEEGWSAVANVKTQQSYTFNARQSGTYYFYVKDAAGNVAQKQISIEYIDKDGPNIQTLEISNVDPRYYTNQSIILKGTAQDELSGIVGYQFSASSNLQADSPGWKTVEQTTEMIEKTSDEISENGTYYFYVKDKAGNVSKRKIEINIIDKIAPTLTINKESSSDFKHSIEVKLHYEDNVQREFCVLGEEAEEDAECIAEGENKNGHMETEYSLSDSNEYVYYLSKNRNELPENAEPITYSLDLPFEIGLNLTGTYYLLIPELKDEVGNKVSKNDVTIDGKVYHTFGPYTFDNDAPTITVEPINENYTKNKTITITVNDVGSGLASTNSYQYYLINDDDTENLPENIPWVTYTSGVPFTIGNGLTGDYDLLIKPIEDNLGNVSNESTLTVNEQKYHIFGTFKFDNKGPEISIDSEEDGWSRSQMVSIDIADYEAGLNDSNSYQYFLSTQLIPTEAGSLVDYEYNEEFTIGENLIGSYYMFVKQVSDNLSNVSTGGTNITIGGITYHRFGPYKFDNIGPKVTVTGPDDVYTKTKNLTITVEDEDSNSLSDENEYQYYLSNSGTSLSDGNWTDYTSGTAFSVGSGKTGNYYLYVKQVEDSLENKSSANNIVIDGVTYHKYGPYKFDNIGPIFTVTNPDSGWVKSKGVTISVTDNLLPLKSDNSYQYYLSNNATALSGGSWTNYTNGTAFTIGTNLTGEYYLFVKRVNDNTSNISTGGTGNTNTTVSSVVYHRYGPYKFDNQGPIFTVTNPDSGWVKSKSVTISLADSHVGSLKSDNSYQYYLSNSATALSGGNWTNYTSGTAFTIGSGLTGQYYLFVKRVNDNLSNISTGGTGMIVPVQS